MVKKLPVAVPGAARLILDYIGMTEAPNGYVTIFGNRQSKLKKPLTSMTIGEVIDAQKTWSGKAWAKQFNSTVASSAAGYYQFMRATLIDLCTEYPEISGTWLFDAGLQDRLGFALLIRRGYHRFIGGSMTLRQFGNELAKEWASFPVLEDMTGAKREVTRGESYYAGDGVNKALAKAAAIEEMLAMALDAARSPVVIDDPHPEPWHAPAPQNTPESGSTQGGSGNPAAPAETRPVDPEQLDKPLVKSKTVWQWGLTMLGAPLAAFGGFDWRAQLLIVAVIAGFGIYAIKRRADIAKVYRELKAEISGDA